MEPLHLGLSLVHSASAPSLVALDAQQPGNPDSVGLTRQSSAPNLTLSRQSSAQRIYLHRQNSGLEMPRIDTGVQAPVSPWGGSAPSPRRTTSGPLGPQPSPRGAPPASLTLLRSASDPVLSTAQRFALHRAPHLSQQISEGHPLSPRSGGAATPRRVLRKSGSVMSLEALAIERMSSLDRMHPGLRECIAEELSDELSDDDELSPVAPSPLPVPDVHALLKRKAKAKLQQVNETATETASEATSEAGTSEVGAPKVNQMQEAVAIGERAVTKSSETRNDARDPMQVPCDCRPMQGLCP